MIGVRLVPLLVQAGHVVAGMTRSAARVPMLTALGAEPVVCDVYDAHALTRAVAAFSPDILLHQLTDLPDDSRLIREHAGANARIRREGTQNLIAAARAAGATHLLAQSVAWDLPGDAGAATADLERAVLAFGGVVLRYGQFYGEGTYHADARPDPPRIQIDEAARRTLELLHHPSGILIVADDN